MFSSGGMAKRSYNRIIKYSLANEKGQNYLYMQWLGWILKELCWVTKANPKRLHTTWFHLYNWGGGRVTFLKGQNEKQISGCQELEIRETWKEVSLTINGQHKKTGGDETVLYLYYSDDYTNLHMW